MNAGASPRPLVLVVEDDPWVRALEAEILAERGFEVLEASNGYTATRLLASRLPALILLDLALPERPGQKLLADLKRAAATRTIPVVVVSARVADLGEEGWRLADAVVKKPFGIEELIAGLRQAIEKQVRLAAAPARSRPTGRPSVTSVGRRPRAAVWSTRARNRDAALQRRFPHA